MCRSCAGPYAHNPVEKGTFCDVVINCCGSNDSVAVTVSDSDLTGESQAARKGDKLEVGDRSAGRRRHLRRHSSSTRR
jgi:hypothetical protein